MDEPQPTRKPRDARTVEAILKSMGVESYDPRVVNQLLELLYRYVSSLLTDAREFSEHADKTAIDTDDIRLAIRSKCAFSFTQPPPRDVTMRLAAERNAIPLPPVDHRAGLALPPPEAQLSAQNYHVVITDKHSPVKTPQSSPKRPRLASSPRPAHSPAHKTAPTPERTPASANVAAPKSVQSPVRMNIDSPLNKSSPTAASPQKSTPASMVVGTNPPQTSPLNKSPAAAINPAASSSSPVMAPSLLGSETPKQNADVVMLDSTPTPQDAPGGLNAANTRPTPSDGRLPTGPGSSDPSQEIPLGATPPN